jgi:uncharacterized protein
MRWRNPRKSSNIGDRRGRRVPMKAVGGGIGGLILLVIIMLLGGGDPSAILNDNTFTDVASNYNETSLSNEERELADFVSVVLADTRTLGMNYSLRTAAITGNPHLFCSQG